MRGRIKGKTGLHGIYGLYGTYVITKLLPSRQIVHSTQQVVYLAHVNMHTNHLLVYSLAATIVNKCYNNHAIVCTFKWKPLGRWSGTVENAR